LEFDDLVEIGRRIEALEKAQAKERQKATQPKKGQKIGEGGGNLPPPLPSETGKTRDKVAAAVGISGKTYEKVKAVVEVGESDSLHKPAVVVHGCHAPVRLANHKIQFVVVHLSLYRTPAVLRGARIGKHVVPAAVKRLLAAAEPPAGFGQLQKRDFGLRHGLSCPFSQSGCHCRRRSPELDRVFAPAQRNDRAASVASVRISPFTSSAGQLIARRLRRTWPRSAWKRRLYELRMIFRAVPFAEETIMPRVTNRLVKMKEVCHTLGISHDTFARHWQNVFTETREPSECRRGIHRKVFEDELAVGCAV